MLAIEENPPMIPPDTSIMDIRGTWHAIHTKVHQEKKLAWSLLVQGVPYYLPMRESIRFQGRRKVRSMDVLLDGYLFFCGDSKDKSTVLSTGRVVNLLPVKYDRQKFVNELIALQAFIASGLSLTPCPFATAGSKVRIADGAFQGYEGTVIRRDGRDRFLLSIGILGRAVEVEGDFQLEAA